MNSPERMTVRRYTQSRERSAELLRLVVPQMYRNPAACNPESYALWYEHLAGINRSLSTVLEEREAAGNLLTDVDVETLYRTHIAERDALAAARLQHELVRLMDQVGQVALGTGQGLEQYGAALEASAGRLSTEMSPAVLRQIVDMLSEQTRVARGSTTRLCAELEGFRRDMQALRAEVDTLRQEALTDALTGLLNRRGFERRVAEFALQGEGIGDSSVLLCDVDNFKRVNDAYGHLVGDRVLAAIGRVLKLRVRGRDAVGRWGGEEFAIFLPETAAIDARHVAEQIRLDVARGQIKRIDRDEFVGSITMSIGIAEAAAGEGLESVLERADAALYAAKAAGRNRTMIADRTPALARTRAVAG
jgi:diguanylate cyclase